MKNIGYGFPDRVMKVKSIPIDDVSYFEVGHCWRVVSIDRCTGEIGFDQPLYEWINVSWWDRLMGRKSRMVIFLDGKSK